MLTIWVTVGGLGESPSQEIKDGLKVEDFGDPTSPDMFGSIDSSPFSAIALRNFLFLWYIFSAFFSLCQVGAFT